MGGVGAAPGRLHSTEVRRRESTLQRPGREAPRTPRRWRTDGWPVRALLCLGVFFAVAIPGTTAAWTDPVAVSGTTISTGTADLRVDNSDAPAFTAMNASTMEGGDSTAGVLTVKNNGDVPLTYYVSTSATNADGKNLASQFAVRVTNGSTTGSAPNVTCTGTVRSNSASSFGGDLLGSASTRRSLAVGASETLCVEASLPNGTAALGGTTNITFTFEAITGTPAAPGWTDTVQTSGTTLSMITAFYLGVGASGNTKAADWPVLPLKRTSPTETFLYNYDTDKDSFPGRLLTKAPDMNSTDKNKVQTWRMAVGSSPLTVNGTVNARIWTAVRGFDTVKDAAMGVGIYDCDTNGAGCITLATGMLSSDPVSWTNGVASWVVKNLALSPSGSYTFPANRAVEVRVFCLNDQKAAAGDLMLAYDTTTYKSALIVQ